MSILNEHMESSPNPFEGGAGAEPDHPPVRYCEAHGCDTYGMPVDDGDMRQCPDCESWYCPAHLVPDAKCHEEICMACADERTQQRLTPPDSD